MHGLVIVIRGLRPAFVGCYGSPWPDTPALDRLAAEGIVFDRHIADQPDAAGARRSWRTGRYCFPTPDGGGQVPTSADLIDCLHWHGVVTELLVDGSQPLVEGFGDGWDKVQIIQATSKATALERTLDATSKAIKRLAGCDNWLLWVELATLLPPWNLPDEFREKFFEDEEDDDDAAEDPEEPGDPEEADEDEDDDAAEEPEEPGDPEEADDADEAAAAPLEPLLDFPAALEHDTAERLMRTYAGAVAYLDACLEPFLAQLRKRRYLDQLLVGVTGDYGLVLGEHGFVGDQRPWLYHERSHVPLLVRLPGAVEAGRRVLALTQAIDLMPTLLDAFGLQTPPQVHGQSLLPLLHGKVDRLRDYACAGLRLGQAIDWALWTPEWSFHLPVQGEPDDVPRSPRLFVQPDDRWEVNDLRHQKVELADGLEQTLRGFVSATQRPGALDVPVLQDGTEKDEG